MAFVHHPNACLNKLLNCFTGVRLDRDFYKYHSESPYLLYHNNLALLNNCALQPACVIHVSCQPHIILVKVKQHNN